MHPLILKEIVYRLLIGGQGAHLGHMIGQADTYRISKAIGHLRENFDKPLNIPEIARDMGMSISGFHHHFKSVTAMSPLQYHKQIRLQEARRLNGRRIAGCRDSRLSRRLRRPRLLQP